ncbi:unnamed protein product, partial [Iphiclides podalirius]
MSTQCAVSAHTGVARRDVVMLCDAGCVNFYSHFLAVLLRNGARAHWFSCGTRRLFLRARPRRGTRRKHVTGRRGGSECRWRGEHEVRALVSRGCMNSNEVRPPTAAVAM